MLATLSYILSFEIQLKLFDNDVICTRSVRILGGQCAGGGGGGGSIEISRRFLLDFLGYANQESFKY
jgi:hypothetical protein